MSSRDINQPGSQFAAVLLGMVALSTPNVSPIFLGSAADRLGFDFEQIGMLMGAEILGISVSAALAVAWIHRVNWRIAALIALSTCVIGNLISAFVTEFSTFIVLRGTIGLLGEGVAFAIGVAALGETRNPDRAFSFMVMAQVGLAVIGLLGYPYIEAIWGIAGITVPIALIVALTMPFMRWLPTGLPLMVKEVDPAARNSSAAFLGIAAQFFWFFGAVSLFAFIERIGVVAGFEKTDIGLVLALGMGLSLIGSVVASIQGDRYSRAIPFVVTMAVQAVFAVLLIDVQTIFYFATAWIVINAVWNYGLPFLLAGISAADASGRYVVLAPAAQGFGGAVGTSVAGWLVASMGLSASVYLIVVMNTVAAVLFIRCVQLSGTAGQDSSGGSGDSV